MKQNVLDYLNGNVHALGSFYAGLVDLLWKADSVNLKKLQSVYPEIVEAFREWSGK